MKIAIVTAVFPPYRGGIGNVAEMHARALSDLGHEVAVFAPGPKRPESEAPYRLELVRPWFTIGKGAFLPQLFFRLRGFDAVFLHYPAFGVAEVALFWRLVRGRRSRFFVVYHMDPIAPGARGAIFDLIRKATLRPLLDSSDGVIVSSLDYAMSGMLAAMPAKIKEKFIELPFAVDVSKFAPRERTEDDVAKFGLADRNLLFVGGLDRAHYFKGVTVLLEAFAKTSLMGLKLHIVGSGDLLETYKTKASSLKLGDSVIFHGALDDISLAKLLSSIDALVLPSVTRSEAFGLVLLEAMASGKPVIATRLPGVRTVVHDGETGLLVEPGDRDALAGAIRTMFADDARRVAMGAKARESVVAERDLETLRIGLGKLTGISAIA